MDRESFHLDIEPKRFEAADAFQFNRLRETTRDPERTFRNAKIERVAQRASADDTFRRQIWNRTFLLALEMEPVGLNLAEMDFHETNFFCRPSVSDRFRGRRFTETPYNCSSFVCNAFATRAGTKSVTSPPMRAISFTIRQLRYVYSSF